MGRLREEGGGGSRDEGWEAARGVRPRSGVELGEVDELLHEGGGGTTGEGRPRGPRRRRRGSGRQGEAKARPAVKVGEGGEGLVGRGSGVGTAEE